MAINDVLAGAINDQIALEMSSAYVYLSMATHFEAKNLAGFAHWMQAQAKEEMAHAMRLYTYLSDRGGRVVLQAIPAPPTEFDSTSDVIGQVLGHERKVSAAINSLYELAVELKDYPTQTHLHWFIDEQVEEEKQAEDLLARTRLVEKHPGALLVLDRELAARTE